MMEFLLNALGRLFAVLPEWLVRTLCIGFGELIFRIAVKRRRLMLSNLHHAFPDMPRARREAVARESSRRMAEMALFVFASSSMDVERMRRRFRLSENFLTQLRVLHENPKPLVILVPHFSLMEALTVVPELSPDVPKPEIGVIFRPFKQPSLDRWVHRTRERYGLKLLSRKAGFSRAMNILRNKGWIAVLFDQNAGDRGVLSTFFDRLCSSTELPGLMQQKFATRFAGVYVRREGLWRGEVQLIELPQPKDSIEAMLIADRWLEDLMRQDEECLCDWLWAHNRWNTQQAPDRLFRLTAKKNALARAAAFRGRARIPRNTRFWIRMPDTPADCQALLPLLGAMRRGRPDAEITLLLNEGCRPVVEQAKIADRLIQLPPKNDAGYFAAFKALAYRYPDAHIQFTDSRRADIEAKYCAAPLRLGIEWPGKPRRHLTHTWIVPDVENMEKMPKQQLWEQFLRHFGLREALADPGRDNY
jgi:lauroyl/myristoyl acyltransferase